MMNFFDKIFSKLFPNQSNDKQPLVHELITRNTKDTLAYEQWLHQGLHLKKIEQIKKAYNLKQNRLVSQPDIHLFQSSAANGFAISYDESFSEKEMQFLFDYLKEKVISMNYRLTNSDRKITDKNLYVETIEKHFLKPPLDIESSQSDQQYGNILLEYALTNDQPSYLKVMAFTYSDRAYNQPLRFDDFINTLLSP
jgi:hypothetical protein